MEWMHAWLVSWLTRPSMHTQHQRHRLIQNKRVFEVLFYKTHRILLVSHFFGEEGALSNYYFLAVPDVYAVMGWLAFNGAA